MNGWARLLGGMLTAILIAGASGCPLAPTGDASGPESISFGGTCLFGDVAGDLSLRMTSGAIGISGGGQCQGNAGPASVAVDLTAQGSFGCEEGSGTGSGSLVFDPEPPTSQESVAVRAAVSPGSIHVVITDATGSLLGQGTFVWDAAAISQCLASGGVSTPLSGPLNFADS